MTENPERHFEVCYQYATYSGTRHVWAEDADQAKAKVRRELRPHMTLPMAHESYTVVEL